MPIVCSSRWYSTQMPFQECTETFLVQYLQQRYYYDVYFVTIERNTRNKAARELNNTPTSDAGGNALPVWLLTRWDSALHQHRALAQKRTKGRDVTCDSDRDWLSRRLEKRRRFVRLLGYAVNASVSSTRVCNCVYCVCKCLKNKLSGHVEICSHSRIHAGKMLT